LSANLPSETAKSLRAAESRLLAQANAAHHCVQTLKPSACAKLRGLAQPCAGRGLLLEREITRLVGQLLRLPQHWLRRSCGLQRLLQTGDAHAGNLLALTQNIQAALQERGELPDTLLRLLQCGHFGLTHQLTVRAEARDLIIRRPRVRCPIPVNLRFHAFQHP
jgi:hypothetical protein